MSDHNIISVSGGKDSTALLLLSLERQTGNMQAVFADTGNEHPLTYEYVQYLNDTVFPIRIVRADFSLQIARKREYVLTKWAEKGVAQEAIDRAANALVPTGNPFLDLCIWKGRFPSSKAAFCTEELKRNPIVNEVQMPLLDNGDNVISWQGVRRDESIRRRLLSENELKKCYDNGAELWNYRPILDWTAQQCFDMHKKHGIKHNPLYEMGMARVGCMPCINSRKDELLEISKRFPEVIDRIEQWEQAVKQASKHQAATFFAAPSDDSEWSATQTIRVKVEWAKTKHGGKLYDMFRMLDDGPSCSSIYGLCE
jgi:3'-phosphoadenosine 5'-phosphosulfate sulfotransferase (PAPS reductase)/FAD synthetase